MRSVRALLLSSLLMAVSISHIAMEAPQAPSIKSEVSPRNNPVDFEVTGIEIGNSTASPKVWEQPDSTNLEYLTKGEAIQVNVTFLQRGVDPSPVTADAKLEIWHPIGAVSYTHLTLPTIYSV